MQPVTIHRSLYGLLRIFLAGLFAAAAIFALAWVIRGIPSDLPLDPMAQLLSVLGIVVLLVTVLAMVVYDAGKIVLTSEGITVLSYKTLFWSTQGVCEWRDVEDVTVETTDALGGLLSVGSLTVETAGAKPNLSLTWVPHAGQWQEYILKTASAEKLST